MLLQCLNPATESEEPCEIKLMAQAHLDQHADVPIRQISCECHQGVLYLRGTVTSFYHKQLAQEAVRLPGVRQVVNEIEVID